MREKKRIRIGALHRLALVAGIGVALAVAIANSRAVVPDDWHGGAASADSKMAATAASNRAGFADIVDTVKPAVIGVRVALHSASGDDDNDRSSFDRLLRGFGAPKETPQAAPQGTPEGSRREHAVLVSQGAGFFISADGYAVTNYHLVQNSKTAEIRTDDDKTLVANVVGSDPKSDLALLKVDGRSDFPHVKLADGVPRVGDWALAVGNPFGLGSTVTAGIVSARGRDIGPDAYQDLLQIDAPVNQGSSGGPTFNVNGEVIGVNTAIFSPSGGSVGIAFAVPADEVNKVVSQLRSKGAVTRGWIGLEVQPITAEIADGLDLSEVKGALVAEPQAGSPGHKAGIAPGDVVTSIDDKPIADSREFSKRIGETPPGTSVNLTIIRNSEKKHVAVALGEFPKQEIRGAENKPDAGEATKPAKSRKDFDDR